MGLFDGTPLERPVLCERCGTEIRSCHCPPLDTPAEKQSLKIRLDRRKHGKLITVISNFHCSNQQIRETLAALKNKCGAGGSIEEGNIELHGDHTPRLPELLIERGYRVQGTKKKE
jgi:translation initiation factor 1